MKILPLFIPHQGCPFSCIYCNQYTITSTEQNDLQDFKQLIDNFCRKNLYKDKEIAFFGGTFTALEKSRQEEYLGLITPYLGEIRGVRLSTRPDFITEDILEFLIKRGVSTIELGIQSFNDQVLKASQRGYNSEKAISSCRMIKQAGLDLIIQLMPGLPEDKEEIFRQTVKQTVHLMPSGVRLYPTVVLSGTKLADWYKAGNYSPLTIDEAVIWLKAARAEFSEHKIPVIKMGLHSDITPEEIVAGPYDQAIGELVKMEMIYERLVKEWSDGLVLEIPLRYKSLFLGHGKRLLKRLKSKLLLDKIAVQLKKAGSEKEIGFRAVKAQLYW